MATEPQREPLERALRSILWELRQYLDDVVVIGGWVPHLYKHYGNFSHWMGNLSLTAEVDVLVSRELAPDTRAPLKEILIRVGFAPVSKSATAAVWLKDPVKGEKIEFLVQHQGTAKKLNRVIPIKHQEGIGAISLTGLDLLQSHTNTLRLPAQDAQGGSHGVNVRLPTLGAYVVNKAATFNRRQPRQDETGNTKRAKDLLYLRDIMSGGEEVEAAIRRDLRQLISEKSRAQHWVDTAANDLDGLTRFHKEWMREAGDMLAEREGRTADAATADLSGHLVDMAELLLEFRAAEQPRGNDH